MKWQCSVIISVKSHSPDQNKQTKKLSSGSTHMQTGTIIRDTAVAFIILNQPDWK